jgi:hypothetical protein
MSLFDEVGMDLYMTHLKKNPETGMKEITLEFWRKF